MATIDKHIANAIETLKSTPDNGIHPLNATYLNGRSYEDIVSRMSKNRHFKSRDSGRNNGVYTYYKFASFPIDNAGNSCSLTVDGRIGGWNNGNKGYLSRIISNRDGVAATGTLIGNADLNLCDLVVYTSGTTSTNSTAVLYIKTYSWFAFDFTLGTMSGAEDIYDGKGSTATPSGTFAWSLNQNRNKFLQIRDDGDVLKQGQSVALVSQIPSVTHYTARLYVGVKDNPGSGATSNGSTYLKLFEDSTRRDQYNIKGTGATTVTSDGSGNISINTPTKAADADKLDGQDSSYYLNYNNLKNRPTTYKYTYQNGYLVVQAL